MRGNGKASVSSLNWGRKSEILGWHVKRVDMLLCSEVGSGVGPAR